MKTIGLAAAALAAVAAADIAAAATFNVTQQNPGSIFGAEPTAYSRTVSTNLGTFGAGVFRLFADDVADGVGVGSKVAFDAFCIDLDDDIDIPDQFTTDTTYFTGVTLDRIELLFSHAPVSGVDSDTEGAATQIALWEIITDSTLDLTAGGFSLVGSNNAATVAQANAYLALVAGGTPGAFSETFTFLRGDDDNQDVIAFGVAPVPLPASVWLLGGALAGLGALRRKREV